MNYPEKIFDPSGVKKTENIFEYVFFHSLPRGDLDLPAEASAQAGVCCSGAKSSIQAKKHLFPIIYYFQHNLSLPVLKKSLTHVDICVIYV